MFTLLSMKAYISRVVKSGVGELRRSRRNLRDSRKGRKSGRPGFLCGRRGKEKCKSTFSRHALRPRDVNNVLNWISDLSARCTMEMYGGRHELAATMMYEGWTRRRSWRIGVFFEYFLKEDLKMRIYSKLR